MSIRPNDVPWMKGNIRKLIRQRHRLHQRAKRSNTDHAWLQFRQKRNEVTQHIRRAKSDHKESLIQQINENNVTSKNWFKMTKSLLFNKNTTNNQIPTLVHNNNIATTDIDKANMLNNHFCKQSNIDDENRNPPLLHSDHAYSLSNITVSIEDVKDAIAQMDPSKASGPDLISPRLLREAAEPLSKPLATLFNLFLTTSQFPQSWKMANVTPIFKKI